MPDDAIVRRLCALLSEACGAPEATLGATSSPRNLEAWDSFSNLTLMLSVEEEYGVKFATSDMINLKFLGDIAAYVEAHRPGKAG